MSAKTQIVLSSLH